MTDATADEAAPTGKPGKKGLIIGVVLAVAGAAGGFALTNAGFLPIGGDVGAQEAKGGENMGKSGAKGLPDVVFVDLPPVIVSLNAGNSRHLKFHAQLEANPEYAADVEKMRPRIMDVLNGYLRAIEVTDLQDPLALARMRGHLLRRINIVMGEGRVRDVLVMEFVLN